MRRYLSYMLASPTIAVPRSRFVFQTEKSAQFVPYGVAPRFEATQIPAEIHRGIFEYLR